MTTTRPITSEDATKIARRLLADCVITAVSTLSATLSVEFTRRDYVGNAPNTLRLQTFTMPTSTDSARVRDACAELFRDARPTAENIESISASLILTALKEVAAHAHDAQVTPDGSLEIQFSSLGRIHVPTLAQAEEEFSWILDVPHGFPGEGQSLDSSGDGSRLTSSFG